MKLDDDNDGYIEAIFDPNNDIWRSGDESNTNWWIQTVMIH